MPTKPDSEASAAEEMAARASMSDEAIKAALLSTNKISEKSLSGLTLAFTGNALRARFVHPFLAAYHRQAAPELVAAAKARFGDILIVYEESERQAMPLEPRALIKELSPETDPFDAFLPGDGNGAVLTAVKAICQAAGQPCHCVHISGPGGCGKTLLLKAINDAILKSFGQEAARFSRAAAFQDTPEKFWQGQAKALLLDDVDAPDMESQERLAWHWDMARNAEPGQWRRLIVTSSLAATKDCASHKVHARLARKLKASLTLQLRAPDLNARAAWVEREAHALGLRMNKRQIMDMARFSNEIAALDGLLQKLKFYGTISGQTPTQEELARLSPPGDGMAAWKRVLNEVAAKLEIRPAEILGKSRLKDIAIARQIAMWICRRKLGLSYPEIGRLFGGRDHATVMHSVQKIQRFSQVDKAMNKLLTELEAVID